MSTRKHRNDRFGLIHAGLEKNKRGGASRTAWAKIKKEKRNVKPKQVASEAVKQKKVIKKESKRQKYLAKKANENRQTK